MTKYEDYQAVRKTNPAFLLNHIGRAALERAKLEEKHKSYNIIIAQLMCSFTIEAVVNCLGLEKLENWKSIEKNLSVKQKILLISEICKFTVDFGSNPFQKLSEIIEFRNNLVHAKPSTHSVKEISEEQLDENDFPKVSSIPDLLSKWEQKIDVDTALQWRNEVDDMCKILSDKTECMNPIVFGDIVDTWGQTKTDK